MLISSNNLLKSQIKRFIKLKYNSKYFQNKVKYCFASEIRHETFLEKLKNKQYAQVLGYSSTAQISALTDNQLKKQYLAMIKMYHSDNVIDLEQKIKNQQITKCIILAYEKLIELRNQKKINSGVYSQIYKDEDEIAMKMYGKKFNDIKYNLYKEENKDKREQFIKNLDELKKSSKHYQYKYKSNSYYRKKNSFDSSSTNNQSSSLKFSSKLTISSIASLFILVFSYQFYRKNQQFVEKQQRKKNKLTLSSQKIKEIQKKSIEIYEKKLKELIQSFFDEQPPALKLSNVKDPDLMQQLIEYTIAPDINLYEVPGVLMANKFQLEKFKQIKNENQLQKIDIEYKPFELTKIKTNSIITLSLQAERCLQNIYIKVKDVADQIEQNGKYTPPKIFFKFYGYIMFEIREKPLSLINYRDTEYISLFDLFFDYYSSIPLKRHEYNEYLVGFDSHDEKMFGQVHLNHRKIPERYIGREDKVVVMRDQVSENEKKYFEIWNQFYEKYMRIWIRQNPERISTQHL